MLLLAAQPFGLPSPAAKALSPPAECSPFCTEKAEIFGGDKDARLKFWSRQTEVSQKRPYIAPLAKSS
eukprot:scaffold226_cov23-Phaeocystis_antarctica.AAC.1